MHIVYVSREYPPSQRGGGISSYLKIVAEGFASRGHRVTVIAASDDTRKESEETINGVRIIRLSGGDFLLPQSEPERSKICKLRFLYRFHSYRKKIRETILRLQNPDIIEVAEYGAEGLFLTNLKTPIVYRLHTPGLLDHNNFSLAKLNLSNILYYYEGKKELQIIKRQAKYITSCSTSLKEWFTRYVGIDKENIKVIYNPISPNFKGIEKSDPSPAKDRNLILFAGTVCDWKGSGDLSEAVKLLIDKGVNCELKMAGKTGSYADELRNRYGSYSWFEILGKLPQRELKDLYSKAAVVCFPSWWENMPMVCIEAMACGAIVIGSNSGGMSEIIEDGLSGFLLPPKNPGLWAYKIQDVINLPTNKRNEISQNAKQRIEMVFSLDTILDKTENYYKSVIN